MGGNLDDTPDALVIMRYERDGSSWKKMLLGKHVMIVDEIILSPALPEHIRPFVQAGLIASLLRRHSRCQKVRFLQRVHSKAGGHPPGCWRWSSTRRCRQGVL